MVITNKWLEHARILTCVYLFCLSSNAKFDEGTKRCGIHFSHSELILPHVACHLSHNAEFLELIIQTGRPVREVYL